MSNPAVSSVEETIEQVVAQLTRRKSLESQASIVPPLSRYTPFFAVGSPPSSSKEQDNSLPVSLEVSMLNRFLNELKVRLKEPERHSVSTANLLRQGQEAISHSEELRVFVSSGERIDYQIDLSSFGELKTLELEHVDLNCFENVSQLNSLSKLSIKKCSEPFEAFFGQLIGGLESLSLVHCGLSNMPHLPSQLRALKRLDLSRNQLQSIPNEVTALVNLKELILDGNKIVSLLKAPRLPGLSSLSIASNHLETLEGIEAFPDLASIDISKNRIWDVYEIGRLSALKIESIRIANNPLTKLVRINRVLLLKKGYRTNVLHYFKMNALTLCLDGRYPDIAEQNSIKSLFSSLNDSPITQVSSSRKRSSRIRKGSLPIESSSSSLRGNDGSEINENTGVAQIKASVTTPEISMIADKPVVMEPIEEYQVPVVRNPSPKVPVPHSPEKKQSNGNYIRYFQRTQVQGSKAPAVRLREQKSLVTVALSRQKSIELKVSGVTIQSGTVKDLRSITAASKRTRDQVKDIPSMSVMSQSLPPSGAFAIMRKSPSKNMPQSERTFYSSGPLLAHRPMSSSVSYARSGSRKYQSSTAPHSVVYSDKSNTTIGTREAPNDLNTEPSIPLLEMTNSLLLFLRVNVVSEEETIHKWTPITYIKQSQPFVSEYRGTIGVWTTAPLASSGFEEDPIDDLDRPPRFVALDQFQALIPTEYPGYLLVTDTNFYIFAPTIQLRNLKRTTMQEHVVKQAMLQVEYTDPSKQIKLLYKIPFNKLARVDLGYQRQYFAVHFPGQPALGFDAATKDLTSLCSLVVLTRNKETTDIVAKLVSDSVSTLSIANMEDRWTEKMLEENIIPRRRIVLKKVDLSESIQEYDNSVKSTLSGVSGLVNYLLGASPVKDTAWTQGSNVLTCSESLRDSLDPSSMYALAGYVLALPPSKTPFVKSCSLLATKSLLHLFTERFDVWPPSLIPPELFEGAEGRNKLVIDSFPAGQIKQDEKGYVADVVPTIGSNSVLRALKIADIVRIERWKSWRWSHEKDIKQLNQVVSTTSFLIQNGCIGKCSRSQKNKRKETAFAMNVIGGNSWSVQGWQWWLRIFFTTEGVEHYTDIVFSYLSEANRLLDYIKSIRGVAEEDCEASSPSEGIQVLLGDD